MYRSISLRTFASVVAVLPRMNAIARVLDHPSACIPVSTTSRQARTASKDSIPSRASGEEYRPNSSASRSAYRPQPSTYTPSWVSTWRR